MKKSILFFLTFILLLSTAGCGYVLDNILPQNDFSDLIPPEILKEDVDDFSFTETVALRSEKHDQINEKDYYQRSFLNDTEKAVYDKLAENIRLGKRKTDIRSLNCSEESARKVQYALLADYPQFFYLSGRFVTMGVEGSDTVSEILSLYFDGVNADDCDEQGNILELADRNLIESNIKIFNKKVSEIADGIPTENSDIDKEKLIYNYLQDTVKYNEAVLSLGSVDSNSYSAFGAICEGLAVCEGYSEAFQYLCYSVGINSTVVIGKGDNQDHEWNAVCLDSEWYMADITWDDAGTDDLNCYNYFNVTENYIKNADHVIFTDTLNVPSCTSDKYAFYNIYGMRMISQSESPANYKNAVDYVVAGGEKYLHMYVEDSSDNFNDYILDYILSSECDLQKYIAQKGYKIKIDNNYMVTKNYLCFRIIPK